MVRNHPRPSEEVPGYGGFCRSFREVYFLTDDDPLGVDDFATHRLPLDEAPAAYEAFQKKQDGTVKVLLKP